ncbi:hypothetical protein BIFBIF_00876 [Bifidobacterium bifidum ATCC 29521 = JCM 1255 = DSM 20456]|nr:hypothetical protein BIFBIF_00876 [Bifidobacterium bifidum ATCC 29521 = JCM 1255 = DSM 20456]
MSADTKRSGTNPVVPERFVSRLCHLLCHQSVGFHSDDHAIHCVRNG